MPLHLCTCKIRKLWGGEALRGDCAAFAAADGGRRLEGATRAAVCGGGEELRGARSPGPQDWDLSSLCGAWTARSNKEGISSPNCMLAQRFAQNIAPQEQIYTFSVLRLSASPPLSLHPHPNPSHTALLTALISINMLGTRRSPTHPAPPHSDRELEKNPLKRLFRFSNPPKWDPSRRPVSVYDYATPKPPERPLSTTSAKSITSSCSRSISSISDLPPALAARPKKKELRDRRARPLSLLFDFSARRSNSQPQRQQSLAKKVSLEHTLGPAPKVQKAYRVVEDVDHYYEYSSEEEYEKEDEGYDGEWDVYDRISNASSSLDSTVGRAQSDPRRQQDMRAGPKVERCLPAVAPPIPVEDEETEDDGISVTSSYASASLAPRPTSISSSGNTSTATSHEIDQSSRIRQLELQLERLTLQNVRLQRASRLLKVDAEEQATEARRLAEDEAHHLRLLNVQLQRSNRLMMQELDEIAQARRDAGFGPEYEFLVQQMAFMHRQLAGPDPSLAKMDGEEGKQQRRLEEIERENETLRESLAQMRETLRTIKASHMDLERKYRAELTGCREGMRKRLPTREDEEEEEKREDGQQRIEVEA
ncbi:uncharacterized protein VTP21DRAFT_2954 [Calcarisporiella thermophila]|uniref:uncharacterized protein n=1 Tax=Calcarisporiella thermophila TaxID=911321 RepID=UPI0037448050